MPEQEGKIEFVGVKCSCTVHAFAPHTRFQVFPSTHMRALYKYAGQRRMMEGERHCSPTNKSPTG